MSVLIAVPVFRVSCRVGIDRGRSWSVIDELVLWAIVREPRSIATLARDADLPHQVIIASIARLMRFRLVEVTLSGDSVAFRASEYGFRTVASGETLPFFPKRVSRRVSFVIDAATGDFFPTREVRIIPGHRLDRERQAGYEVRSVHVEGGAPSMSHEANMGRLSDIAVRGWDEQVATIDGKTATLRDDEFMVLRVIDGIPKGLPESAGANLRDLVAQAAALPPGTKHLTVTYTGEPDAPDTTLTSHACPFEPSDLVIGGSAHRQCLVSLLSSAHRRVIIHSTFLDPDRFRDLMDAIRTACVRGVTFDLLWGAELDNETERKHAAAAIAIARLVREDEVLKGRVRVHMRTTGSHAKLILLDTAHDGWIAGVGSCNWLSSPFEAVEMSVVLRDQQSVADVAVAIQRLVGRRGLSDDIATEMSTLARDLRRMPPMDGSGGIALVVGDAHDRLIRAASSAAVTRFVVGSHRLGSTARPGALMQGEKAAQRPGVRTVVFYTRTTGPLKNRHARALAEEAGLNGVILAKAGKIPLHGKFVAWDDDNLVVTSLNWASASADPDFPCGEVGVHICAPGIAAHALTRLEEIFPELAQDAGPVAGQ
ncbi:Phosphatidylserine synthase [Paraburkholderia sacchari]|uniref:phospholipase D-like domain-containing protein n=1 Tax=Paraburkholderia sacchari TaxID=159450 RepID=UPI0039A4D29F